MPNSADSFRKWQGELIRLAREDAGFDQISFADAVGVKRRATISDWENGKSSPSYDLLERIAEVTKRPLLFFFPQEDPLNNEQRDQVEYVLKLLQALPRSNAEYRKLALDLAKAAPQAPVNEVRLKQPKQANIPPDILEALSRADDERLFRVRLALGIEPIQAQAPKASKKKA